MKTLPRKNWKTRIGKKSLSAYPEAVAETIKNVAEQYDIKSFMAETVAPEYRFYAGEGYKFVGIGENGQKAGFEVVSEHSFGAAGLSHKIGEHFYMPAGTHLIQVFYYTKYFMTVYKIQNMLTAAQ